MSMTGLRYDSLEQIPEHLRRQAAEKLGMTVLSTEKSYAANFETRQSEATWQVQVINLLHEHGWTICEFRKARVMRGGKDVYRTPFGADGIGFPDLFAVRPPRVLLIENKSENGKAEPEQVDWLMLLGKCPQLEVICLRPTGIDKLLELIK
jgi:hypothetical protein